MAGIYIHIPFCKTRCSYCDFFTATDTSLKTGYVKALCNELILRKNYIDNESIQTIYFGGGTPSQLNQTDFEEIFGTIYAHYEVTPDAEITLEANPDDLNIEYISMLGKLAFNRISMGVQSFNDKELHAINRRHSANDAKAAVYNCQQNGFDNISIDLMYGLPGQTMATWHQSLLDAIALEVQHISSYHLIYEEGTKMHTMLERGKIIAIDEDISLEMFAHMNRSLKEAGFIHYEVSNFCKKQLYSRHNASYWKGAKYLGIGASAHSYNGNTRCWNISSMTAYIDGIESKKPNLETEELSLYTKYNDYVLTRMRTMWGADMAEIEQEFGEKLKSYFLANIKKHFESEDVKTENGKFIITEKGLFVSDGIMSDLMYIDNE